MIGSQHCVIGHRPLNFGMGPGRIGCHNQTLSVWCVIGSQHCVKLKGHSSVGMGPGIIGCHNQTLSAWCLIESQHCVKGHSSVGMGPGRIGCHNQTLSAWCLIGIQHRLYLEDREQQTVNANQIVCPIMMNHFIVTASQNGSMECLWSHKLWFFHTQYIHILLGINGKIVWQMMMYLSSYLQRNATNAAFSPLLCVCYSAVACLATMTFTLAHKGAIASQSNPL